MSDAETALADLVHFVPDILLCEVTLPGMDGIKFVESVRQLEDETKRYVPIIMCTAHTEQHRVVACRDAGAHEVLNKPMSVRTLYQRIVSVIERPRSFIYTPVFTGPDRRRSLKDFGTDRRSGNE